jgi:hypothetical protein
VLKTRRPSAFRRCSLGGPRSIIRPQGEQSKRRALQARDRKCSRLPPQSRNIRRVRSPRHGHVEPLKPRRSLRRGAATNSDYGATRMVGRARESASRDSAPSFTWRERLRAALTVTVRAQIVLLVRINAMLPTRAIAAAALSVLTVACAEPPKRMNPVGLSFAAYEDTTRRSWTGPQDRPLSTAVWYPAALGSRESEWRVGIFNAGWNAQHAPLSAATSKRALIVLSHGTGGGAAGMA